MTQRALVHCDICQLSVTAPFGEYPAGWSVLTVYGEGGTSFRTFDFCPDHTREATAVEGPQESPIAVQTDAP